MPVRTDFQQKKNHILQQLSVPLADYEDLSPKGSVDVEIRDLIDEINAHERLVTTSSCAGRVSVFLEGDHRASTRTKADGEIVTNTPASEGGKGGGGRWLYVSHTPMARYEENESDVSSSKYLETFGLIKHETTPSYTVASRLIHFKFEPMILHVLCADAQIAQKVLTSALQAGFRESGATNIASSAPSQSATNVMVAVRSTGLALDSVIGLMHDDSTEYCSIVDETCLRTLVSIATERFQTNTERIHRLQTLMRTVITPARVDESKWEDAASRRERKIAEGLQRQAETRLKNEQEEAELDLS